MNVEQSVASFVDYHRLNSRKNTIKNYEYVCRRFRDHFQSRELESIGSNEVLEFLNQITEKNKQSTKKLRYSLLNSFFNFMVENVDPNFRNPCDVPVLKKIFKDERIVPWDIIEKDLMDEIIFRTQDPRNRLILELMARGAMRISEVLKLIPKDVDARKLTIRDPKSGQQFELVFIPQKVADHLKDYIRTMEIKPTERIFPIAYNTARAFVMKAGAIVGILLRPHDLRRHAATYASRSGTPLEIVSKIILCQRCSETAADLAG